MLRNRLVLIVMGLALLGFAPAPFPRAERSRGTDQSDVGGTWEFVAWEYNGRREHAYEKQFKGEITREQFVLTGGGGTYKMRIDPSASPPSFTWSVGDSMTHAGSYRLNRDEIIMVFVAGQQLGSRPTDFSTPPAQGWRFIMRRVKRD